MVIKNRPNPCGNLGDNSDFSRFRGAGVLSFPNTGGAGVSTGTLIRRRLCGAPASLQMPWDFSPVGMKSRRISYQCTPAGANWQFSAGIRGRQPDLRKCGYMLELAPHAHFCFRGRSYRLGVS